MLNFILKQRLAHLGGLGATNVAQRDRLLFSAIFPVSPTKIDLRTALQFYLWGAAF